MQNVVAPRPELSSSRFLFSPAPAAQSHGQPLPQGACSDHQFISLLDAYRDMGGLAPVHEVLAFFRRHSDCDPATVTRLIVNKRVICFGWQSTLWLPLFQFKPVDMSQPAGLSEVLTELSAGFDPWQVANWFVQPNPWLQGCTPAALIDVDPSAVLLAARSVLLTPESSQAVFFPTTEVNEALYA